MAATKEVPFVSLNPDDFVQGGLSNDVDAEITEAEFTMWDYNGALSEPQLFVRMELKVEGGDVVENYWSAGKDFAPDEKGERPVPTGSSQFLRKNSNFDALMNSLVNNCSLPKQKLNEPGGIKLLHGASLHWVRVPAPERIGLERAEGARKPTILIAMKVNSWPWDKGKKKAPAKPAATGAAPTAASTTAPSAADVSAKAKTGLDAVLGKVEGGSMKLSEAKVAVFRDTANEDKEIRNAIVRILGDEEWLVANGFILDGENVVKM
jgi:hypothetical protein